MAERSEIKTDIHDEIDDEITSSKTLPRESEVSDSEQEKKKKAVECK
eukprot:CAMPEP_0201688160 /NCGR_PEP_ID=MMETSP0578-20130828/1922_1 /ASSEMBLY_ACC=CAM_ASM_000663 /TAXON_ID=267565 /ORGANISM="Skeletonema grethea, Strain CCMP 1804" /LENGTH=46 /DNA_ID= /DNA_START= /DNA_END= /DNA_ORIENTATION=